MSKPNNHKIKIQIKFVIKSLNIQDHVFFQKKKKKRKCKNFMIMIATIFPILLFIIQTNYIWQTYTQLKTYDEIFICMHSMNLLYTHNQQSTTIILVVSGHRWSVYICIKYYQDDFRIIFSIVIFFFHILQNTVLFTQTPIR